MRFPFFSADATLFRLTAARRSVQVVASERYGTLAAMRAMRAMRVLRR
jgi:hypothetical protein